MCQQRTQRETESRPGKTTAQGVTENEGNRARASAASKTQSKTAVKQIAEQGHSATGRPRGPTDDKPTGKRRGAGPQQERKAHKEDPKRPHREHRGHHGEDPRKGTQKRTVHTMQQTVFWGWLSCACCCATTGALVGACRNCGVPQLPFLRGRAMLGLTMDTCSASSRVAFGRISTIFHVVGWTRILGSILVVHCTHGRRGISRARRQQWLCLRILVLLVMHLALCS